MNEFTSNSYQGADNPLEKLQVSVERVTFHNESSGFCVLRVKVKGHRELVTVIGSAASVTVGEYIECSGFWINDRQHGQQLKRFLYSSHMKFRHSGTSDDL